MTLGRPLLRGQVVQVVVRHVLGGGADHVMQAQRAHRAADPGQHLETVTLALSYPLISVGVVIAGAVALGGFRAWRRQRYISTAFD